MMILPLKFIGEEDKKTVGLNLYNLAKLSHLGLPVVDSLIIVPPFDLFRKILNKYLKHNLNIKDYLSNLESEILNLPLPENLRNFELAPSNKKIVINTVKLWENLLQKWSSEILSRLHRGEKALFKLTPQLIIFSANFTTLGHGYFDEDRHHAVIKTDKGNLDFKTSSAIENLIIVANKKLLIPQIYHWGIEDGKIKIIKVTPFTQSLDDEKSSEETLLPRSFADNSSSEIKTATKIFLDSKNEALPNFSADGVLLNIQTFSTETINNQITKIHQFNQKAKIIFYPDFNLNQENNLKFAKDFLFFKNKKNLEVQIVLPETFSVNEFLNLKREYAALGIYSKGSLKIWKQFNTVSDFLNLEDYLESGFDGALIDLDKISKIVSGVEAESILNSPSPDQLEAIKKFFIQLSFKDIIKNHKLVLIKGRLAESEELLNLFLKLGVWGIAFENRIISPMREHISFLEKQTVKKLSAIKIQH